jgi:peptide-methionine (S)-S-oxide reductase
MQTDIKLEKATLGNGCFWCTEAIFQQLKGVTSVVSGYSGGQDPSPNYKTVCSGSTGHAECLEITYDSAVISFPELLEVFFSTHDPTSLNRQGEDIGTQYRSVIFYHNDEQLEISKAYIKQLNESGKFAKSIVTTLEPYTIFHPAEDYHQNYFNLNGHNPYCRLVVKPKVEKFVKQYNEKLK